MVLDTTLKEAFSRWLGEEAPANEQVGILVELAFIDDFLKKKRKGRLFSGDAEKVLHQVEDLSGNPTFHKYVTSTVASQHKEIDEYVTGEIARMKTEQLDMAADYYCRFLRRRIHDEKPPAPAKEKAAPKKKCAPRKKFPGQAFYKEIKDFLSLTADEAKEVKEILEAEGEGTLWNHTEWNHRFKLALFTMLDERDTIVRYEFLEEIPYLKESRWLPQLDKTMKILGEEGLAEIRGDFAMRYIPKETGDTMQTFLWSVKDKRARMILDMRLDGESLKTIGETLYITRERVRQISVRLLETRPTLAEDRWKHMWAAYGALGHDLFRYLFNVNLRTVNYLKIVSPPKKSTCTREEFLCLVAGDETLPEDVRRRAKSLLE